jgi:hypothetical protein
MSQLHNAPITSDIKELSKWYIQLSEDEKIQVIRDIATITHELQGILLNAIIPNMALSIDERNMRDEVATRFLKVINEIGLNGLSKAAQSLFESPAMDAQEPVEENPSNE